VLVKADGAVAKKIKSKAESFFLISAALLCPVIILEKQIPIIISVIIQLLWFFTFIVGCVLYQEYKKRSDNGK